MFTADRDARPGDRVQESLAFLHTARPVQVLRPAEVEWIARHLPKQAHRSGRRVLWPALAVLTMVLAIGATVAAAKSGLRSLPFVELLLGPAPASSPGETRATRHGRRPNPRPQPQHPVVAPSSLVVPAPAPQPVTPWLPDRPAPPSSTPGEGKEARPRRLALQTPGAPHTSAVQPSRPRSTDDGAGNPAAQESRSFASVIEPWHRAHDANTTLRMLDEHEQRYPRGIMRLESRVLRADIYLAQAREREALVVLDGLSLTGIPRARELQTTRGELRIKFGRCADGKRDLNEVLVKGLADAQAKRAVQALSRCP